MYATLSFIERVVQLIAPENRLQDFAWETWYLAMS